jgi:Fur family peroxide stress response transcriptional regulator
MEKLRRLGLKLTPQRIAIIQYLDGNTEHPSADAIYKSLVKKYPTISMATVYNTLEVLTTRGHIRELTIEPQKKRFDSNTKHHNHLICVCCKKIVDIHRVINVHLPPEEQGDFEIIGHHIEFYGYCSTCNKKRNSSNMVAGSQRLEKT